MINIEKKILKLFKRTKAKYERSFFIILGDGVQKVPYLYKLVTRETSLPVTWFSSENTDIKKNIWITNDSKDEENSVPEVTHVAFRDIENTLLQPSYFTVIQDMKNIKPSDLACIVDSVLGKGVLIFIFSKVKELEMFTSPKVCDLTKSRFMKRLFASFTSCPSCLVLDENLNILFSPKNGSDNKMMVEKSNIEEQPNLPLTEDDTSEIFNKLIGICNTADQSNFLRHCLDTLKRRTIHCTISVSSPRGRGKSIVLGLAIAGAIALKYSNIFISSLTYENVKIIFKYLLIGLDVMQFKEDEDYDLIQSVNPKFNNVLLGLNIFRDHPQAVRFIYPGDVEKKLEQAELVVIDEAAAMPLPLLKKLLGPYIVLMSSTTEGCGGSGKYLYENMISEIHHSSSHKDKISLESLFPTSKTSSWKQFNLSEPINYSSRDEVESWINRALCLECNVAPPQGCPDPESCRLFYVCRETLFSYELYAENFLQELVALFFCTKRIVSSNLLQEIADDDSYHIFCLVSPHDSSKKGSANILCAILVHTEKRLPWNIIYSGINQHGDLQECFNKWTSPSEGGLEDFVLVQGLHILDIVTYPNYRKMGYGSRALQLLQDFYEGKWISLDDTPYVYSCKSKRFSINNALSWPPLLLQLTEVEPEKVDYIVVSYFLTADLLRFWKKVEFVPVYISGEKNSAQEHLCFMMKAVGNEISNYMEENWRSFCDYYFMHLNSYLKCFPSDLALNLLNCKFSKQIAKETLTKEDIDIYLKPQRMKALEKYCQNLSDLHCIMPCIPILAKLFFSRRFVGIDMSVAQQVILLAFGVQHKTVEDISADLSLHTSQVHGLLNRTVRKLTAYLTNIIEKAVEKTIAVRDVNMEPVSQSLDDELEEAAQKIKEKQIEDLKKLKEMDFSEFAIKGSEDDWEKALHSGRKTLVSIKSLKKASENVELPSQDKNKSFKHKKKEMKRRR